MGTIQINKNGSGRIEWPDGSSDDFQMMDADAKNRLGQGPAQIDIDDEDIERFAIAGRGRVLHYD